jgi:rubrerythrin
MKVSEGINILKTQMVLGKTPATPPSNEFSRPLSDYAKECVQSVLSDEKNYESELIQCLGCGFIISVLLASEGCPNCGVQDLTSNIVEP